MKEIQIRFIDSMVRAILDGRKTQRRWVINPQPNRPSMSKSGLYPGVWYSHRRIVGEPTQIWTCPYGVPGDRLWVREAFTPTWHDKRMHLHYRSDGAERFVDAPNEYRIPLSASRPGCFAPSVIMPRWASRITLEVTDVRVQRLQDISVEDALCEGITHKTMNCPRMEFAQLWNDINGPGSWDENPWVWVLTFRKMGAS